MIATITSTTMPSSASGMRPSVRLVQLGLSLPSAAQPSFNYVPVVVERGMAYVSGQLPKLGGEVRVQGRLGDAVSLEQGREAARICALQALACLAEALGSIDRVARIVRLSGFVASTPEFFEQPAVIDPASELMVEIFGECGRHARSAVGVAVLPRNAPVEIEVIAAIRDDVTAAPRGAR
jgi:enamine deaminase RidA (YjgF/YER057c/UK114 family)